jgi:serine/threonine-protein kinase
MSGYELFSEPADGSGSPERLSKNPQNVGVVTPISWSPDGVLAFADHGDIWLLPRTGNGEPRPFFQSKFTETMPAFSSDGHWLAYVSDESGKQEVYVRPYPGPGAPYAISTEGGTEPTWAGGELFYRSGGKIMVFKVNFKLPFSAARPTVAFAGSFLVFDGSFNYDVSSDGKRFVMFNADEQHGEPQINFILNWFEELKERVPVSK